MQGDASAGLRFAADSVDGGSDEREVLGEILEILRAVLLMVVDGPDSGLVAHSGQLRDGLAELASQAEAHRLESMIYAGLQGRERMRQVEDRRLVLELALLAMARAGTLPQLSELLEAARSGAVGPAVAAAPTPAAAPAGAGSPAAAAPAAAAGSLHGRLLAYCEQHQPLLGRTLEQCSLEGPDERGHVVITPRTERRLHRDRLAADGVQRILRDALRELTGGEVSLTIGTAGQAVAPKAAGTASAPPPGDPKAIPGPSVQKVVERFDGQIVDRDDSIST